jgi:hypothetical protein
MREMKLTGKKGELIDRVRTAIYASTPTAPADIVEQSVNVHVETIDDMVLWLDKAQNDTPTNALLILYHVTTEVLSAPGFYDLEIDPNEAVRWAESGAKQRYGETPLFFNRLSFLWIKLLNESLSEIRSNIATEDFDHIAEELEKCVDDVDAMYGGTFEHRFPEVIATLRENGERS